MRPRTALLLAALASIPAYGRDLSAFGVLRVDLPQPSLESAAPGRWTFDTLLGYQNTWSMSPNVRDYFEKRPAQRRLDNIDVGNILGLPGEKFLADLELGVIDFTVRRQFDAHWSARGTVGLIGYTGGFMDGPIENFHNALGFSEYLRTAVPRNQFNMIAGLKETLTVQRDAPSGGLLDPEIGVRYSLHPRPDPWNVVIDGALKIPVGGERAWLSNGGWDAGLQATLQGVHGAHSATASLSAAYSKGGGIVETGGYRWSPGFVLGYAYAFDNRTSAYAQGMVYQYPLNGDDTAIDGLRKHKSQLTLGVRHRAGDSEFSFAIVEAFGAYNGMPDFGVQFGWTLR